MPKYDPLFEYLCRAPDAEVELTFDHIGQLVGGLPTSATTHSAWWANESEGTRHVQARAWMSAGREVVAVDQVARSVRFSAPRWTRGS